MADTDGNGVAGQSTLGDVRKREMDILNALLLMFTYGQLFLILWDMLMLLPGGVMLANAVGIQDPAIIHSRREMTVAYLGFLSAYITRNAVRRYQGKEDTEQVPHYVFLGLTRGYFYLALWGTLSFVAYMLFSMGKMVRMPYELVITVSGVTAELFGGNAVKGFLNKRAVGQLQAAADASDRHDLVMNHVDAHGRITRQECCEITKLADAQGTRVLEQLEKEGLLEQRGEGRGVYYVRKGSKA